MISFLLFPLGLSLFPFSLSFCLSALLVCLDLGLFWRSLDSKDFGVDPEFSVWMCRVELRT